MVALILGEQDEEMRLLEEVLSSRVAQLERISLPFGGTGQAPVDVGAYNLVIWYISLWVAAYLSLLHKLDPADSSVYSIVRNSQVQK
jgi:hypothetical protein